MDRKTWLKNFITLCETGAKTLEFRRLCRIKAQHLPRHVKQLAKYRKELAKLEAAEAEKSKPVEAPKEVSDLNNDEELTIILGEDADEYFAAPEPEETEQEIEEFGDDDYR